MWGARRAAATAVCEGIHERYHEIMKRMPAAITRQVVAGLKQRLKRSGLTYNDVARHLGLSEVSVKRLFAGQRLTIDKLQGVADLLQLPLSELFHDAETSHGDVAYRLTPHQEEVLAGDFRLYSFFVVVVYRVPIEQIMSGFKISRLTAEKYLLKLDRLGIVELHRNLKYRLLVSSNFTFERGGPIESRIITPLSDALIDTSLDRGHQRAHEFFVVRMTPGLVAEFSRRFRLLSEELLARALREDSNDPSARNTGFMLLLRPFETSVIRMLEHGRKRDRRGSLRAGRDSH
jgi:transcriptional regulator with XRE-family HTH domain